MCPQNDESAVCFETLATTQPTATALGLPIDTSCGADENADDDCVTDLLKKFAKNSTQSVLIVWDIQEQGAFLEEDLDLGTDDADADDAPGTDSDSIDAQKKVKRAKGEGLRRKIRSSISKFIKDMIENIHPSHPLKFTPKGVRSDGPWQTPPSSEIGQVFGFGHSRFTVVR
ncbi:hypothetical protein CPB84DRAFT_1743724 [Gymnopilus junonius]|uniref:Uncharacterized protein n=1 Tax=Gymnopilus junonius TaxID=109634 RepID=A0A9P5TRL7_GYMJU|nr:hypothetical protein CPB84DRAFT_1743724 [Gymnopilus junonius]